MTDVWSSMKTEQSNLYKTTAGIIKNKLKSPTETQIFQSTSPPSLCLLLFYVRPPESCLDAAPHLSVHQSTHEDHSRAHPVPGSEGVLEINDGEDEADELSECHHQGDGQRSTLCGQDEHTTDTNVSEETVKVSCM